MKARKQSSTSYPILFLMVDSTDHVTGKTGLTPTVTISKNGGAFASPSGAVTELSSGWYAIAGNATDRNTVGELLIHATGTGADPLDDRYLVVPFDPFDANALGMAYLTGDAYARLGAPAGASVSADVAAVKAVDDAIKAKTDLIPAAPASTTNITAATGIDITKILGTAISTPATAGILDVNVKNAANTAWASGAITAASLATDAAAEIADAVWDEGYDGHRLIDTFGQIVGENWYEGGIVASLGTDTINSSSLAASAVSEISNAVVQDVWNTSLSGFPTAGSAGKKLNDLPTANQNADALLDRAAGVETGLTPRQALRLATAALAGKISGAGTATVTIRNTADTKDRITATVDPTTGNRTAITTDLT